MRWELIVYAVVATGMACFSILTVLVSRRREAPGIQAFVGLVLAATLWSITSAFEKIPPDVPSKILISKIQYLGIVSVGPLWFTFALQYTRRDHRLSGAAAAMIWLIPALTLALVWTNELHHLIWTSVTPVSSAIGAPSIYEHGPFFWVMATYNYLLLIAGSLTLIWTLIHLPTLHKLQGGLLLAGIMVPWLANLAYLTGLTPEPGLDLTPLSFLVAGVLFAWNIFQFQMLDLAPIARDAVFEQMADGLVVLDVERRIMDLNNLAQKLAGVSRRAVVGKKIEAAFPGWGTWMKICCLDHETVSETELPNNPGRRYELRSAPLDDPRGRRIGFVLSLRDITRRSAAEEGLRRAEAERRRLKEAEAIDLERNRIAQEIHDGLAQNMAALRMRLRRWGKMIETAPERLPDELQEAQGLVESSLLDARRSIFALRPLALTTQGFLPALQQFAAGFSEYYNVQVHLDVNGVGNDIPEILELTLFRIIQESLNNIARHAGATQVWITLSRSRPGYIQVSVCDNGAGFDPAQLETSSQRGSYGLRLMRERVLSAGGQMQIESQPGKGTTLTAQVPVLPVANPPEAR